jgi:hypothetical protein
MTWREKLAAQIGVMNTMATRVSPTEIRGQIV